MKGILVQHLCPPRLFIKKTLCLTKNLPGSPKHPPM